MIRWGAMKSYGDSGDWVSREEAEQRIEEQQQLLELWMLYYTDGMPDDELRDLYCDSIEVLEDD